MGMIEAVKLEVAGSKYDFYLDEPLDVVRAGVEAGGIAAFRRVGVKVGMNGVWFYHLKDHDDDRAVYLNVARVVALSIVRKEEMAPWTVQPAQLSSVLTGTGTGSTSEPSVPRSRRSRRWFRSSTSTA